MESIKPFAELMHSDSRHEGWIVVDADAPAGERPLTLKDRYDTVAGWELSEAVPEGVRSAYNVARMLWVYGWFYWPFYTIASLHAILSLDMALLVRWCREDGISGPVKRSPSLREMLERAVRERWITDEGIAYAKGIRASAREEYENYPPELRAVLGPNPWEESDQRYCNLLLESIPKLRDAFAHPKNYWHGLSTFSLMDLENVHGLIQQLIPAELDSSNVVATDEDTAGN